MSDPQTVSAGDPPDPPSPPDPSPPDPSPSAPSCPPDPNMLIEDGQAMVRSLAMQIYRSLPVRMELDDLIAYGQIGLAEAAQKFDPTSGTRFTSFAYYRIRGAIYDGVSKMNWTSRARIRRMRYRRMADDILENASDGTAPGGGSQATSDASWLGQVTEQLAVVYLATGEGEDSRRALTEAPDPREGPGSVVANRELQQRLHELVQRLPPDGMRLIRGIYFEGFTLTEAADRMGISKSWASRLHARSLEHLARLLRDSGGG